MRQYVVTVPGFTDQTAARPNFRESPFYTILEPLTSVMETKGVFFRTLLIMIANFDMCG